MDGRVKSSEVYGSSLPIKVIVSELSPEAYSKNLVVHIQDNNTFELEEIEDISQHAYPPIAKLLSTEEPKEPTTHKFGQQIVKPYGTFTVVGTSGALREGNDVRVVFNHIETLASIYNGVLNVASVNKYTSVLSLTLTDPIPERGQDIIKKLIEIYNEEAVEDKKIVASNTLQFIDERLKYLTVELTDVEKDVESYKRRNEVTDVSAQAQLYIQKAGEYNKQLADWEIQIDVLQSIEQYLNKQENQYELVPSTLNIQDPTLVGLIGKFNELQLERQRMLRTTQPNNPLVLNINDQLANLRVNILENLRNIKSGLIITRDNLKSSYAQFESRIQKVPSIERDLLEINRQQGVKQELYLFLLQKREESAMSLAGTISNLRVIDEAVLGDYPVRPRTTLIYALALILGIGLPMGFLYMKEVLNDKVQERKDVESLTSTPILGEIAHNNTKDAVVVTSKSRTPVAELFRLIRANLQFATGGRENKVIMVTSSMSGEGKTFVSINLGASLVLTGKKVVVLGFDLRKSGLTQSLGLFADKGITSYLISDVQTVDEVIISSRALPDLYVIGAGPIPPNPSELMLLPGVGKLIEELKTRFDYVI
ncbi:MAG: capsular biosynthesis protein, partial [Pontibacter sp.]|nr:capsular biosynthesis protein [Pontibacter sp.]